jgi:hypothetical protein
LGGFYSHATSELVVQVKEIPKKSVDVVANALARINAALDRMEQVAASRPAADSGSPELESQIVALREERDALDARNRQADERIAATIGRLEKLLAS